MNKKCFKCKKIFPISMFYKRSNGNFHSYCKTCHILKNKEQVLIYINKEDNYIKMALRNIFSRTRMFPKPRKNYHRKGWVPEITLEEIYEELFLHIQLMKDKFPTTNGRLCRYCEQPWTTMRIENNKGRVIESNFSIDRFDSNKTYMKGNVIFCCAKCNSTKKDSTKKDWLKYLKIDKELHEENKTK
jgi:hypothetical protein